MSQPTPQPKRAGKDLMIVVITLAIIAAFGYWILSACGQF